MNDDYLYNNFHSSSNPLPYLLKPSTLLRYSNNKSIIVDKTTTNNSLTTKYAPSSSNCVDVIVDVVDDHLYNETKNNLDDYIQIENDGDFIKNKCKQGKEQNGFVVGVAAADGSGGAVADVGGSGEEMKMDVSSVVQPSHAATTTTTSASTLFSTKIIQNIPVLIEEEESGLDFLASTASLLKPIETNKSTNNSENNKGNLFNEQNSNNNNKMRHSTFTK
uniref:Candidate secreted effector n=1 Tax=Meloidogyne incognita TaxID=6306 RepID=A0A914LI49_MELIC